MWKCAFLGGAALILAIEEPCTPLHMYIYTYNIFIFIFVSVVYIPASSVLGSWQFFLSCCVFVFVIVILMFILHRSQGGARGRKQKAGSECPFLVPRAWR